MRAIDIPTAVRAGEALDVGRLAAYLREQLPEAEGELEIRQFPAGFSNLTYAVTIGHRRLVLRRPPFGTKARSAHDMGREYRVLSALRDVFAYAPRTVLFCEDPAVMDCDFYLMERIDGVIVRRDYPVDDAPAPAFVRAQQQALIDVMTELHAVDYEAVGLAGLGRPEGYIERQVRGWSKRYRNAMTPDAPDAEAVMEWLQEALPEPSGRAALIHNDYKLDNVIFDPVEPTRLIGVLDWEMATLGDPLMDLGCTLAYWIQADDPDYLEVARMMPTNVDGALTREEIVERYGARTGVSVQNFDFYYIFGLFRLAVIVQQIYYRYYHGQTQDQRFASLVEHARALMRAAAERMTTRVR